MPKQNKDTKDLLRFLKDLLKEIFVQRRWFLLPLWILLALLGLLLILTGNSALLPVIYIAF